MEGNTALAARKYSPEFKDACVQEVIRNSRPVPAVARESGVVEQTLRNWVNAYKKEHPVAEPELSVSERARLKELEAENRELRAENEFLGKSDGLLREETPVSVKYAFIHSEEGNYPVVSMCRWACVSRSGYHTWKTREPSARARRRADLAAIITFSFDESDETYGHRRVHADLVRWGIQVDDETVRSIMRELDLLPCQPRPWRPVTTIPGDASDTPDLVRRDFTATEPGRKLVGDITYIPTWEGWLYLATVLDCFSKKVVGYAMAEHMRTSLVTDALDMAARNGHIRKKVTVMHTDRGTQYTSDEYAKHTKRLGITRSAGRTGVCYDNAWAESFNGTLKNERVHRTEYPTRKHARFDITRYIELRYNPRRLHSALGYQTPNEVEEAWYAANLAA
ncbi:IS3 family transposase [Methylobacillus pratensis]